LKKLGYDIFFEKRVKSFISEVGFDEKYGARPIKRAIQEKIEDLISEEVLKGNVVEGGKYKLRLKNKNEIYIEEKGK
jgi:ATP-dependent Clp protease ATP-binding subunit ClpC